MGLGPSYAEQGICTHFPDTMLVYILHFLNTLLVHDGEYQFQPLSQSERWKPILLQHPHPGYMSQC